jgi:ribosomal protein S18 acetylase RimI-like enzyme
MIKIRPFRPSDLDALYDISLATGHLGGDASNLYDDRRLMGHIYSGPYARLNPRYVFVAEDDRGVSGFIAGTHDTRHWETKLEAEWWPPLRRLYADPQMIEPGWWTPDQRRASMIHHPEETPAFVTATFPAHLHLNLLPRLQRRGIGSQLFQEWLKQAACSGVSVVHVSVNRANESAIRFWQTHSFQLLTSDDLRTTRILWLGRKVTAKPICK